MTSAGDGTTSATLGWPGTLPVPVGAPLVVGRDADCAVCLQHASVSRRHLQLTAAPDGLAVQDLGSRFGTYVNGSRVVTALVRPGDMLRFGSSPPYRYDGRRLVLALEALGMPVAVRGLDLFRDGRCLLRNVSLSLPAGGFIGIIGPSGVGKSLLLGCLASTVKPDCGELRYDDDRRVADDLDAYRNAIGLVTQDDLVYGTLTVAENLRFAARIRQPPADAQQEGQRIAATLAAMELTPHRDKLVRVLSGGQRKRVNVAIELLQHPRLLLLDEPTSGLDPGLQVQLMELLRRLAQHGVTVVCTTHTLDTLHYFDEVIALGISDGAGTVVFQGPPAGLYGAFQVHSADEVFTHLQNAGPRAGAVPRGGVPAEPGTGSTTVPRRVFRLVGGTRPSASAGRWLTQAAVVAQRSALGLLRDRGAAGLALAQPLALALLIFLTQGDHDRSTFIHFFLALAAVWLGMTATVREIVRERALYIRDGLAGLRWDAYLTGKLAYAAALVASQVILMMLVGRVLLPLVADPGVRPLLAATLRHPGAISGAILVGVGGALIGLIISALAGSEQAAVALLPLVLLPQVLFSRVAYGDGSRYWTDSSPYAPVVRLEFHFQESHDSKPRTDWSQSVLALASLAMLTRPGTAILDFTAPENVPPKLPYAVPVEWLLLVLLLLLHLLALALTFQRHHAILQNRPAFKTGPILAFLARGAKRLLQRTARSLGRRGGRVVGRPARPPPRTSS